MPQIAYYGGSFTAIGTEKMTEYLSAAYEFIEKGLCKDIRVSTRPDCINEEILALLKKYGVSYIYVSDYERADFAVDYAALDEMYALVYENPDVRVYKVE